MKQNSVTDVARLPTRLAERKFGDFRGDKLELHPTAMLRDKVLNPVLRNRVLESPQPDSKTLAPDLKHGGLTESTTNYRYQAYPTWR